MRRCHLLFVFESEQQYRTIRQNYELSFSVLEHHIVTEQKTKKYLSVVMHNASSNDVIEWYMSTYSIFEIYKSFVGNVRDETGGNSFFGKVPQELKLCFFFQHCPVQITKKCGIDI